MRRSIYFKPKNKSLSKKISIRSPSAFRKSIKVLKKGGLTRTEKKALVLARTRAKLMLNRKNLSLKERKQFKQISKIKIGKVRVKQVRRLKRV